MLNYKKIISTFILSAILTGCNGVGVVMPIDTVRAPQNSAVNLKEEDINKLIKNFLTEDIKIEPPIYPENSEAVLEKDIDGDGKNELLITVRSKNEPDTGGILILKDKNNNWDKILYTYEQGGRTARIDFADIDGDGKEELLVSNFIGGSAGNGLSIYKWQNEKLNLIAKANYKKINIEDMPDSNGKKDGRAELGLWLKDTGPSFFTEVYRYENSKLVKAKDVYPYYYNKVVDYYKEQIDGEYKNSEFMWYYYVEALVKAGKPQEALDFINSHSSSLKDNFYNFNIIKAEALIGIKEYNSALNILNSELEILQKDKTYEGIDFEKIYNALGDVYAGLNNKEKAKYYYDEASKIKDMFLVSY